MKKIFTVYLILLSSFCLNAQTIKWEWQNPKPHGNDLNDIEVFTDQIVIMAGNAGVIQRTTNGGTNWDVALIDSSCRDLMAAKFFDKNNGFVVGRSGVMMKTTDAGATWKYVTSGTTEDLLDIEFFNADTGYAVGGKGTILKTKDAGKTWTALTAYGTSSIYKIAIPDAACIYLGSGNSAGRIAKSTDYGATWTSVNPTANTSGVYSIHCFDTKIIVFGTADENLWKSTDGGATWVKKTTTASGSTVNINDVKFVSATEGYAPTSKNIFYKTTDGGETWTSASVSPPQKFFKIGLNAASSYLIGASGSVFKTTDKGATWTPMFSAVSQLYLRYITFLDDNNGYAAGGSTTIADSLGLILKTTDGGKTWAKLPFQFKSQIYSIAMPTKDIWYSAGGSNKLYKSTDGGNTWTQLVSPVALASHTYMTIAAKNANEVYAAGVSGKFAKTTDGGATWKEVTTNFGTTTIYKISMPDTNTIIMGGLSAKLSKSTDGGTTWTALTAGIAGSIFSMKFKDNKYGYICGSNLAVAQTTDGGNTWTPQSISVDLPTTTSLWALAYTANGGIHTCSINGEIISSYDNGKSWKISGKSTTNSLFDLTTSGNTLWASGNGGAILKGTTQPTGVEITKTSSVKSFSLEQNYPNPFNPATTIKYSVPSDGNVTLRVFNVLGKEVAQLVNQQQPAGSYNVTFNASELTSGIYFYELSFNGSSYTRKMLLMK